MTNQTLRDQTLERISHHLATLGSGERIIRLLKEWGVPEELIEYPNTKWRMVFAVLKHYAVSADNEDREKLFEIIGEMLHPLMYNGDKQAAETAAENFNKYLEYDRVRAIYIDADKKYFVAKSRNIIEVGEEDALDALNEDFFIQEQEELAFLRLPENKDRISTLRKAYQVFMNITEVFCDNPSKPSHELNDAYVKTKKLITDAVGHLHLYVSSVNGKQRIHTLTHYFIPFNNLFTAEKEYTPDNFEIDLSGKKLSWDYIRPRMNATYGDIDELYRNIEGSDVLSKPDVQQTLNDVSLLLSKTREKNKETTKKTEKTKEPTITKIEITSMPELVIKNSEKLTDKISGQNEKMELCLSGIGDLFREPKNRYCYQMGEESDRHKIIRFLATNKGYSQTSTISSELNGKSEQSIRTEIGKIRNNIKKFIKIEGKQVLEEGRKGSGYRINPKYKIILQKSG